MRKLQQIKKTVTKISKADYNAVKSMPKEEILTRILYRVHSLSIKDDKWTLTNAYFESRHGNFEVV